MLFFARYAAIPEERVTLVAISAFSDPARWMITQTEKIAVRSKGRFEVLHTEYPENG